MNKLFIVANLKSYKNEDEGEKWLVEFIKHKENWEAESEKEIIVAPSFTLLPSFFSAFSGTRVKLSAQNLSRFEEGAYTGEVNAKQIKDFATHVIIGHSERRKYFHESDEVLGKKVEIALKYGLVPVYCVQDAKTPIPGGVELVAYEPVFAIGSGHPDSPESADKVAKQIMERGRYTVLYGGSVTFENVNTFTKTSHIKGVLVGGESLDPLDFIKIIQNA